MGYVYGKRGKLYIGFAGSDGKPKQRATGLDLGSEKAAQEILVQVEARLAAGFCDDGAPLTVSRYSKRWLEERKARGLTSVASDESFLRLHAMPTIGVMTLGDVRPRHIQALVRELTVNGKRVRGEGKLAPRSIRHVYNALHTMFEDAVAEELVSANPCKLKRGQLPKKIDKDSSWRRTAVFTRDELELLISHPDLPLAHRIRNALLFLCGLRPGEAAALRWRDYDAVVEPLGCLCVERAYDSDGKREKSVKTEFPRQVPVHPVLAKLLAQWKLTGWVAQMARRPGAGDLIVPARIGDNWTHYTRHLGLKQLRADLASLSMRKRRQYDTRRTFISLGRADGAREDLLKWVSHGPTTSIMDVYTTPPWEALCAEVAKLKVSYREGVVVRLKQAVGADGLNLTDVSRLTANLPQIVIAGNVRGNMVGELGLEPR